MSSEDHLLPILSAKLYLVSSTGIYFLEPIKVPANGDEIGSSRKVLFIDFFRNLIQSCMRGHHEEMEATYYTHSPKVNEQVLCKY